MGSRFRVYLGPFVEARPRKVKHAHTVRGCTNERCLRRGKHTSDPFCSQCGGPVTPSKVEAEHDVTLYDVFSTREPFAEVGRDASGLLFLAPNFGDAPRRFRIDEEDAHVTLAVLNPTPDTIFEIDTDSEIMWFETRYASDLVKLRETFDDVRVAWGLHTYWI